MKLEELMKITNAIKSMNSSELNLIVNAVNSARQRCSVQASSSFNVGDTVQFGRPNGRQRVGIIEKMNAVKALIAVGSQKWRVPYSMLKEVA